MKYTGRPGDAADPCDMNDFKAAWPDILYRGKCPLRYIGKVIR